MSTNNILLPASFCPIINPTQDIVLGLYYATRKRKYARGSYRPGSLKLDSKSGTLGGYLRGVYASPDEVRMAYDNGVVYLHAEIAVRVSDRDEQGESRLRFATTTVDRGSCQ